MKFSNVPHNVMLVPYHVFGTLVGLLLDFVLDILGTLTSQSKHTLHGKMWLLANVDGAAKHGGHD